MGAQENGLTLEALARRLETLERENERMRSESAQMRSENAELRHKVTALEGSGTRRDEVAKMIGSEARLDGKPVSVLEGRVSRKSLLSKAGAAAVAAVAAGTLLNTREAKAHDANSNVEANYVYAHSVFARNHPEYGDIYALYGVTTANSHSAVHGENLGAGPGVRGISEGADAGVYGSALKGQGVRGYGVIGVWGESPTKGQAAVYAKHYSQGPGVVADGNGNDYAGVLGRNNTGTGVWGQSSQTGYSGVYGQHQGSAGYGLVGDGKGTGAGVLGRNSGGEGVRGEGSTTAEVAGVRGLGTTGVWGSSSRTGYSGLYGQHTGSSGYGVVGDGTGPSAGVLGRNGSSEGVRGEGPIGVRGEGGVTGVRGESTQADTSGIYGINVNGIGVQGNGKTGVLGRGGSGYGGQFEGGKAQLMLKPGGSAGKPTTGTHKKGEIYMDKAGALFVCTAGDGTTVGTWKKVNMKLV